MIRWILEGFLLGLSTGPYCLGACAPFLVPYILAEGRPAWRRNLSLILEFLLGRFLAYVLFGVLIGWLGKLLSHHLNQKIAAWALVFTSALMLVYALAKGMPSWKICSWVNRHCAKIRMPLVLGFLIGINVCPPFLVAVARLLDVGQITGSIVFFAGFFAGTTLYTLPLLGLFPLARHPRFQNIGMLVTVLVASWFLLQGLAKLY